MVSPLRGVVDPRGAALGPPVSRLGVPWRPDRHDLAPQALGAPQGVGVVVGAVRDVVAQLGEIAGGDGLQAQLLHRPHLDEQLVDQDPEEDEEDPRDDGEQAEDGVGRGGRVVLVRGQHREVERDVEAGSEAAWKDF